MNNIQILFEKLADNYCDYLLIIVVALSILVTSCCITCKIIGYLKYKREREEEIEKQILTNNRFDNLDQRLAYVENELQNIKTLLTRTGSSNKRKCFISRLWSKIWR